MSGGGVLQAVLQDLETYKKGGHEHSAQQPTKVAETYNSLGLIKLHMQKDPQGAKECHEEALRILQEDMTVYNPKTIAVTLNDLGFCCERLEQRQEAQRLYERSKRILRDEVLLDASHPRMIAMERALDRVKLWTYEENRLEPQHKRTVAEGA
eukprot:CAMPEP_0194048030 /NCGR_PEP_ID=MMETSP0009_2-20130614/26617_1 /TAXON_ID=210454 /ORGANISM="Grammatophora oceanica, Strain CCMP 410" /LENGTH=152 /DNA_ID=CAMNT_0038693823 /DNA_START=210 /DNA_END=668 /DNA_ORIENTATION=+